jgi:hypothetical protein
MLGGEGVEGFGGGICGVILGWSQEENGRRISWSISWDEMLWYC